MKHKPKYEILDDREIVTATADTWEDAIYAAQQHAPSLIYIVKSGQCRFVKTLEDVPV